MKYRKGVFIVVYAKIGNGFEYLILKRQLHWKGWEFPKGGIESGEKLVEVVKREVKEETGLMAKEIRNFKITGSFKYGKRIKDRLGIIGQKYILFSAEVEKRKVNLKKNSDAEHSDFKWVNFEKALRLLTWPNQRRCLRIVNKFLN